MLLYRALLLVIVFCNSAIPASSVVRSKSIVGTDAKPPALTEPATATGVHGLQMADDEGGNDDEEDAEGDDDEDELDPWIMSKFDKIWLQVGWIILFVAIICVSRLFWICWPYSGKHPHDARVVADDVSKLLYDTLWGQNFLSYFANAAIVFVALLNLLMFTLQSEARYERINEDNLLESGPLSPWVTPLNHWIQLISIVFVIFVIILRMVAARAHPNYHEYGGNAPWRYLLSSSYVHIEILAIMPSIVDLFSHEDKYMNLIWIILLRSLSWLERQPSTGVAVRQFTHMLSSEGPLLVNMYVIATVLWVLMSGLYYLANANNEDSKWGAARTDPKDEDTSWQRFESIPSSMFFVLVNLCKENPLADNHKEFWSRFLVMTVCFLAVPIFALPAGVMGATLQRYVLDAEGAEPSQAEMVEIRPQSNEQVARQSAPENALLQNVSLTDEAGHRSEVAVTSADRSEVAVTSAALSVGSPCLRNVQTGETGQDCQRLSVDLPREITIPRENSQPTLLMLSTCFLSIGSVFVYFMYTVTHNENFKEGDDKILFVEIHVGPKWYATIDGTVAAIFLLEWIARLITGGGSYALTFYHFVDFMSWMPGMVHMVLFFTNSMPQKQSERHFLQALCVFRMFKPERYLRSFSDMRDILLEHSAILKATFYTTFLLWLAFSCLLYYTERDSTDGDMRANYGSMMRSMWAEAINLHGEWVWCDYSATGKGICTLIALFSGGLFMVPIAVFSDGYQDKLGNMDDVEFDVQPWQAYNRPQTGGLRQTAYDLLYTHLHLISKQQISKVRESLALSAIGSRDPAGMRIRAAPSSSFNPPPNTSAPELSPASRSAPDMSLRSPNTSHYVHSQESWIHAHSRVTPPSMVQGLEKLSLEFKLFRAVSIFFTIASAFVTITLTVDKFERSSCSANRQCRFQDWGLYALDVVSVAFFTMEFITRLLALGWRHPCSITGICDMASLCMIFATLTPLRQKAFRPEYTSGMFIDDMAIPGRLLRLFCLESYFHPIDIMMKVTCINKLPLARALYALITIWYAFGTVLYLMEYNPGEHKEWLDASEKYEAIIKKNPDSKAKEPEMVMAARYPDVLTGLQYALVHLTGDYPISEYNHCSQIAHLFSIVFGMCAVAAFTGIFVAGFCTYLKSERVFERRQEAERRLNAVVFTVVLMQRKFREVRRRREAQRIAEISGLQHVPYVIFSTPEAEAKKKMELKQLQFRCAMQGILAQTTPEGRRVMGVCYMALLINVLTNFFATIPEINNDKWIMAAVDVMEFATGYVFLTEYMIHFAAAPNKWRTMTQRMRLLDLLCLLPTFVRLWFVGQPHRWQNRYTELDHVIDIAMICRVARILDLPYVRRTRRKISLAISTAVQALFAPCVLALSVWVFSTSLFMWCELKWKGPDAKNMVTLPDALYWTAIYIIGEWANVDFSQGAGSRMCIFYCLFGVATFAVPTGIMMEAVESSIVTIAEERKQLKNLMMKSRSNVEAVTS